MVGMRRGKDDTKQNTLAPLRLPYAILSFRITVCVSQMMASVRRRQEKYTVAFIHVYCATQRRTKLLVNGQGGGARYKSESSKLPHKKT